MFGSVPSPAERLIWRGLLGLRLARGRSPATVGGWRIGARGADWIRLETASPSLSCNLLVHTGDGVNPAREGGTTVRSGKSQTFA
jgi:hypothetical protein